MPRTPPGKHNYPSDPPWKNFLDPRMTIKHTFIYSISVWNKKTYGMQGCLQIYPHNVRWPAVSKMLDQTICNIATKSQDTFIAYIYFGDRAR